MNFLSIYTSATPFKEYPERAHKSWEILLQLTGNAERTIGGKTYKISPEDISVVPPGVAHSTIAEDYFTDMFIGCNKLDFPEPFVVHDYDGHVHELMNMLRRVYSERNPANNALCDSILNTIVEYIRKYLDHTYKYSFVSKLKNTMYDNISNADFSIGAECRKMGFNQDYIRRCFKAELGKTPLEYLTDIRLSYAKELLCHQTFESISDVTENCGFRDKFHFSKIFKKRFGMSPMNFRKEYLANRL